MSGRLDPMTHPVDREGNYRYPYDKVVVTGSKGFIGRAVVAKLEEFGVKVVPFDLPDDIQDYATCCRIIDEVDAVIHLAGVLGTHELFDTPHKAVNTNVVGSLNIIDVCATTDTQYTAITMPQVFPSIYTATKIASCSLADAYHHSQGLRCSSVRAFNAYGPGQAHGAGHPQKIIPTFAVNCWNEEPMPIWGDGSQGVDLIHTTDLANILVAATCFEHNQVFDGGSGHGWTVLDTAFEVARIVGNNPLIEFKPMRRGEIPTDIVATGENWSLLPEWALPRRNQDLTETVEWYRDHS